MRVLLVSLPNVGMPFTPLNLLYLAGTLVDNGIECRIVDVNIDGWNAVARESMKGYDIIGISVLTYTRWQAFDLVRDMREVGIGGTIVMGGVHATLMPEQCKEYADVVIKGDGEGPLLDVCQGKDPVERILPIDSLRAAWELIDLKKYPGKGFTTHDRRRANGVDIRNSPRISLQTSRSCRSHCRFCSSFYVQGSYRSRNPVKVADEMELLYSRGFDHFYFIDDSFYLDKQDALKLSDEIVGRKLKVAFRIQTRADVLDEEYTQALKRAGCYFVAIGVETGSERLLETMHKSTEVSSAETAIRNCRKAGIRTEALLIVGNEGETDETIEETRTFLKRAKPTIVGSGGHGLWLFPGTAVYNKALKDGTVSPAVWYERVSCPVYRFSQAQIDRWTKRLLGYSLVSRIRYWVNQLERRLK